MMHEDEANSVLSPQALHDPVDAVARQSEDRVDPQSASRSMSTSEAIFDMYLLRSAAWVGR